MKTDTLNAQIGENHLQNFSESLLQTANEKNVESDDSMNTDTFGITCGDFLNMSLKDCNQVIFGLNRGNVGLLIGGTNVGKSTLALNLSIKITCNKPFFPLYQSDNTARRVLYIDGEATEAQLQADINKMLESCSEDEKERVNENLCLICDQEIKSETGSEPLNIANPKHLKKIEEIAIGFKPDLIIFDTLSALANLNENDNVKARNLIIQPLKDIAKKIDAGILLIHHTGKTKNKKGEYRARGASAWGTLSRVIINLDYEELIGGLVLSCSKIKGKKFDSLVMAINENTRWFEIIEDYSGMTKTKSELDYEELVAFVESENRKVKKSEIDSEFTANKKMSLAKIGRILSLACSRGDLFKEYGYYYGTEKCFGEEVPDRNDLQVHSQDKDLGLAK